MDWSASASPLVTTAYTTYTTDMRGRDIDLVKALNPAKVTVTNPLTDSVRWNSAIRKWELFNGTSWVALIDYFAIEVGAFTGDVTKVAGASALTLASVITAGGPVGGAAVAPVITWDAKGRLTVVSSAAITPAAIGAPSGSGSSTGTNTGDNPGVTSVTGTAPVASSGGTTPAISITAATGAAAGSMSAADKTKLDAITGTNTGNQTITLTGHVTGSGTGSLAASLGSFTLAQLNTAISDANVDAIAGPRPLGLLKLGGFDFAQATTAYLKNIGLQADATEVNVEMYVQKPFTMRELRALAAVAVPASNSVTFTVRKNAADTALTCTIGAGQTLAADTSNVVDFGTGDRWSIKCVSSATAGTNDYSATAKQIDPKTGSGAAQIWYRSTTGGINRFLGELGGTSDPGGSNLGLPLGRCLARAVGARIANSPALEFRRNNASVLTDLTMLSGWARDVLEPGVSFGAADNLLLFSPPGAASALCVVFGSPDRSTLHDPCYQGFSDLAGVQAATHYMAGYGWPARVTESEVKIPMPACTLKNLRGLCSITVPAGQTITVTVRKNGVDTGLTMQFTNGGGTKAADLANTVQFAAGDLLSLKRVSSATTGAFSMAASVEIEETGA